MKKSIVLSLLSFLTLNIFADGGGDRFHHFTISEFEQKFNLYYETTTDTFKTINEKGKIETEIRSTNLGIYSIQKDSLYYLFPESFNDAIIEIGFESGIVENTIQFNNDEEYYPYRIRNNQNIKSTTLSDKLIILTFSKQNDEYTLWTAHKNGSELKAIKVFYNYNLLQIDVYNHCFLFIDNKGSSLSIDKIAY